MKKAMCLLLCAALALGLGACKKENDLAQWSGQANIFVLSDEEARGKSIVAGLYARAEALTAAKLEPGLAWRQPSELSEESRRRLISESVALGGKILICVGAAYETAVCEAQTRYPDVMFLLLDGEPREEASEVYETAPNSFCIRFQEAEAGFLAGYAAVMEGAQKLGFCGGGSTPDMIRYAYGFLQGADYAAAERGLAPGDVLLRFWYAGEEDLAESVRRQMAEWQQVEGLELVFVCEGEGLVIREMASDAAEELGVKLITEDGTRPPDSDALLCVVFKDYVTAVQDALLRLAENDGLWDAQQAGRTLVLGAGDCLGLKGPEDAWPFARLSEAAYAEVLDKLAQGEIVVEQQGNPELMPAFSICIVTE